MEFKIDGDLLNKIKVHRHDAMKIVKKWGLDRFYNAYAEPQSEYYMDANETVFFGRELETVKKRAYNKLFPAYLNTFFVPVDTEGDTGTDVMTYETYESYGEAAIIDDEASDYQRSEIVKSQTSTPVRTIGEFCQWNLQELRRHAMAVRSGLTSGGKSLSQRKIDSAVRAIMQKQEKIVANGDAKYGLKGFFNSSDILAVTIPADGTSNSAKWADKTADLIQRDFDLLISGVRSRSNGVHMVNTVIMGIQNHLRLSTLRVPNTNVSILSYIKKVYEEGGTSLQIYGYPRIDEGLASGMSRIIAYERHPDNIQQEITQSLEVFPPQQKGTAFRVFCRKRHGGVQLRYQQAFRKAEFAV